MKFDAGDNNDNNFNKDCFWNLRFLIHPDKSGFIRNDMSFF
jgi:hypothetical protein